MNRDSDRGSAAVWVLSCAAVVMAIAAVTVLRTQAVDARHRAEAAADLAALAGAGRIGIDTASCAAARRIAVANGAILTRCSVELDPSGRGGFVRVEVVVQVQLAAIGAQRVSAHARAERAPPVSLGATSRGTMAS